MSSSLPNQPDIPTVPLRRGSSKPPAAGNAVPPGPPAKAAGPPCPRCGARLVDPDSLGWCMKCGYCQSLEDESAKAPLLKATPKTKMSPLGIMEFVQLLKRVPAWVWILLGGVAVIVGAAFYLDVKFPREDSLERALTTTITLGVGVLVIFAAQVWAMMLIVAEEDGLGARDLFISFGLWKRTVKRLPETRKPVWLGTWSLTAIIVALAVVGGLDYWFRFLKPKKLAKPRLIDMITALAEQEAGNTQTLEEALQDFAGKADLKKKDDGKDHRPTTECVIIGYQVSEESLSGLVLATMKDDKLVYAGICRRGWNSDHVQEMAVKFPQLVRETPFLKSVKLEATWLQPELLCEVHSSGWERDGSMLVGLNFRALLQPRKPK